MFLKVVQVAGFWGSGKTTTILKLTKRLSQNGKKVAVIVNSLGGVPVDGMVFRESGLKVEEIGGGCICCELAVNLANTVRLLKEVYDPDVVIIEPEGLAIPNQVSVGITPPRLRLNCVPFWCSSMLQTLRSRWMRSV